MAGIDESRQFVPLKIAVLTISDTREDADDKSGATLVERIRAAGHAVAARTIGADVTDFHVGPVFPWKALAREPPAQRGSALPDGLHDRLGDRCRARDEGHV